MIATEPFEDAHVGAVTLTVGATGVDGCAFMIAVVAVETHPPLLFTVTE